LRLELNPKCFCLLSYHHLEFAKFESAQDEDVITMLFLNRAVRIAGKNLRALGLACREHGCGKNTYPRNVANPIGIRSFLPEFVFSAASIIGFGRFFMASVYNCSVKYAGNKSAIR